MAGAVLPTRSGVYQEASLHGLVDLKLSELLARLDALCTAAEEVLFFEAKMAAGHGSPNLLPVRCRRDLTVKSAEAQWTLIYAGEQIQAMSSEYALKTLNVTQCSENVVLFCQHLGYELKTSFIRKGYKYYYRPLDVTVSITQLLSATDAATHLVPDAAPMWLVEVTAENNSTTRSRLHDFQRLLAPLVQLQKFQKKPIKRVG